MATREQPAPVGKSIPVAEQEALRKVAWDLGATFPPAFGGDLLVFASTHVNTGYLRWSLRESSIRDLERRLRKAWSGDDAARGDELHGAAFVLRIHDVTDIDFDGGNAHAYFDIPIDGLVGRHYQHFGEGERVRLAEVGFRLPDGRFHALARSRSRVFDRAAPSGNFQLGGLYVGPGFRRMFPVESVFDAPAYEKLARAGAALPTGKVRVAVVCTGFGAGLRPAIERLAGKLSELHVEVRLFGPYEAEVGDGDPLAVADAQAAETYEELARAHATQPFDLVHCHDWYSAPVGARASKLLNVPFALSLHSTEHERSHGVMSSASRAIAEREGAAARAADLVVVPHSSTRGLLIDTYEASPDAVTIISDHYQEVATAMPDPGDAKRRQGLDPAWPVGLFAGELSHAAGADLLLDGIMGTSGRNPPPHYLIVGEGPLRGELEGKAHGAGLGGRARFLGGVAGQHFDDLLMAADFVVIPARSWQDEGLAHRALSLGKPVLATHQSGVRCVHHGENGLMTYDNPGSIVWGLNEMLSNPMGGRMLRSVARRLAQQGQSLEGIAVEHVIAYGALLPPASRKER